MGIGERSESLRFDFFIGFSWGLGFWGVRFWGDDAVIEWGNDVEGLAWMRLP